MRASIHLFTLLALIFFCYNVSAEDEKSIAEWIKQLGDAEFQKREEAVTQLSKIGKPALPLLKEAEKSEDPEISWRARELRKKLEASAEKKSSAKKDSKDKEWEYKGPGFQFKFRFSNDLEKFIEELEKEGLDKFWEGSDEEEWEDMWKLPDFNWDQLTSPSQHSLTVLTHDKRYEYRWEGGYLNIQVTDFSNQNVENFQVTDLKELKKKHPELYKVYIENGGNSSFKSFIPENLFPKIKEKRFLRHLPKELKKEFETFEDEIRKLVPEIYKSEEEWKKRWESLEKDWLAPESSRSDWYYGLRVKAADPVIREQFNLTEEQGLVVTEVAVDGILSRSGIRQWDLLLKVNEIPISSVETLVAEIESMPEGSNGTLAIIRKGKPLTINFSK